MGASEADVFGSWQSKSEQPPEIKKITAGGRAGADFLGIGASRGPHRAARVEHFCFRDFGRFGGGVARGGGRVAGSVGGVVGALEPPSATPT